MKLRMVLCCLLVGVLLTAGLAIADTGQVVTGEISEITPDKLTIQVGKYIMEAAVVLEDDGSPSGPQYVGKYALAEGVLVQAYLTVLDKETWKTAKVVVLTGAKKEQVLQSMAAPQSAP